MFNPKTDANVIQVLARVQVTDAWVYNALDLYIRLLLDKVVCIFRIFVRNIFYNNVEKDFFLENC